MRSPVFRDRREHCFAGFFDTDFPQHLAALDMIALGERVWVKLRPTTPGANGVARLGRTYIRRPAMRETDYALRDRHARRLLARIGCPAGDDNLHTAVSG
jgi:hypothetical protein